MVIESTKNFLAEVWDNKLLSLFYLIVFSSNIFSFSSEVLGIENVWQRLMIAVISPPMIFVGGVFLAVFLLRKFEDAKLVKVAKEMVTAFFEIFEDDTHDECVETVRTTLRQRAYYILMDWWATFACIGVVAGLNYLGRSFVEVVVATAIYDFVVAEAFMIYSLRTGQDVTFGEGYRRVIDVIHRKSKWLGWFGMVALNAKATIWDGPEQVPIFFKKELGGFVNMTILLVFLSMIQGLFWAWLYSYGYESVAEAMQKLITQQLN